MKHAPGFTLIELLVVVAIIALLIAILVPSLNKARDMAQMAVCVGNMRGVGLALGQYRAENTDYLPPLVSTDATTPRWSTLDGYAQQASGMSDAEWTADQDLFGVRGSRNWQVSMWPFYESTGLFICPSDPLGGTTSLDRSDPHPWLPKYWVNGEAWAGAPRSSYYRMSGNSFNGDGIGWHVEWSSWQAQALTGAWSRTITAMRLSEVHGVPPGELVFMGDLGGSWDEQSYWGCFYGAYGGGRRDYETGADLFNYGTICAGTWEIHPRASGSKGTYRDDPDGGSNWLFIDGHAENRKDFPSKREVGCERNP